MSERIIINNREFNFSCIFVNGTTQDTQPTFLLPYGCIQEIVIIDNIYSMFVSIGMKIVSPRNIIEKIPFRNAFTFNANSRNLVILSISPTDNSGSETFSFVGVINDSYLLSSSDSTASVMTLSIIDIREARLREFKVSRVYPKIDTSKTISEHLKEILSIGSEDATQIFHPENFSLNQADGIRFEYTFPLHFNLYDAVNFLLKYNVSKVQGLDSQFFLRWNSDFDQYDNYSIFNLFLEADSKEYNREGFTLGNQDSDLSEIVSDNTEGVKSGKVFVPPQNMLHNVSYSNVNFELSNKDFLSIRCFQANNIENIESSQIVSIETCAKNFNDIILNSESMRRIYDKVEINFDYDPSKEVNNNYKMLTTTFDNSVNVRLAEAQLYNTFIFQNMAISFTVPGFLYRAPGHFIVMTKPGNYGGSFDGKILGQWLVTEVKHYFIRGTYTNEIQCAKPFRSVNK